MLLLMLLLRYQYRRCRCGEMSRFFGLDVRTQHIEVSKYIARRRHLYAGWWNMNLLLIETHNLRQNDYRCYSTKHQRQQQKKHLLTRAFLVLISNKRFSICQTWWIPLVGTNLYVSDIMRPTTVLVVVVTYSSLTPPQSSSWRGVKRSWVLHRVTTTT